MNNLQIFNNEEFGEVRTITINDEPMFCLADICKALELENTSRVKSRLNQAGVTTSKVGVVTGTKADGSPVLQNVEMTFINESNLYKTIFQSRKKSAQRFTEWVTGEVLPSIRKTGGYQMPKTPKEQIQLLAQGYTELDGKVEEVKQDLNTFKETLPLLAVDCERITTAVRKRATDFLGGKGSNAYADKNLRGRVYSDLHREVKHQFGVSTYKAIRRNQVDKAVEFIERYNIPYILNEEIKNANAQLNLCTGN